MKLQELIEAIASAADVDVSDVRIKSSDLGLVRVEIDGLDIEDEEGEDEEDDLNDDEDEE